MASFTDAISQYNPYIQTLPVDAYTQVGMMKQQQYDQGVQKIQGEIDYVAGLPIAHPEVKKYLGAKLGQMRSELDKNLSADFSDSRLQNQVGGMAKKISADPIIQNGVASTMNYKKALADIEQAKKDGKGAYSIQNEALLLDKANNWLSSKDVNTTFNDKYTPYIDVTEKLTKLANTLKDTENITEIPYKRDSAGQVIKDGNGNPIVDDAMLKVTAKGVGAQKYLQAFYASLSPDEMNQLSIDGWYHYRGATQDTFINDIDSKYKEQKGIALNHYNNLSTKLSDSKLTSVERAALQSELKNTLSQLNGGLDKERQADIQELSSGNLEAYKSKLYTQNYLIGLAKANEHQSLNYEYENNPYAQMGMQRKQLQAQYDRMRMEDKHFNMKYSQDANQFAANYGLKQAELSLKQLELQQKGLGSGAITMEKGVGTNFTPPTSETVQQEIANSDLQLSDLKTKYAPLLIPNYKDVVNSDMSTKDKAFIVQNQLDEQFNKYLKNPNEIRDNNLRRYFESRNAIELQKHSKQNMLKTVTDEANSLYGGKINDVLSSVVGVNNKYGKPIYTAQELLDAKTKFSKFYSSSGGGGMYSTPTTALDTEGLLKAYKGSKYENLAIAFAKSYVGAPLTTTEKMMNSQMLDINKGYSEKVGTLLKDKQTYISQKIMENSPEYRVTKGTLNPEASAIEKNQLNSLIGNATTEYIEGKLPLEKASDFNPDDIVKWTTGKEKGAVKYHLEKNDDGSGTLLVTLGQNEMKIPIKSVAQYFPQYAESNAFDTYKFDILSSPKRTTNLVQPGDPINARIQGWQLPGLKDFPQIAGNVRADVEGGVEPNDYQIRLYYFDGKTWINDIVNNKGFKDEASAQNILNNIGMKTIQDFINQHK